MFLTVDTSITIRAAAAAVWDYACKPENWTTSHNVDIDCPDSLWGRFCPWLFRSYLNGRQAPYDHSFRALRSFEERLEGQRAQMSHE